MASAVAEAPRPAHIPESLVFDFDYTGLAAGGDIHAAYVAVQASMPDIFWTPRNGGHWVVTDAEDIVAILRDAQRFSNRHITLPPMPEGRPRLIPTELDPPVHAHYRKPLVEALLPRTIHRIEGEMRAVAIEAIERLRPLGGCEFIDDFARILPIHVYFRLVDLPLDDKAYLLKLSEETVRGRTGEERLAGVQKMGAYIADWVTKRRAAPGDDLLSQVIGHDVGGKTLTDEEAVNYAAVMLFGGLETVATMMGFFARFLAEHPDHRRELAERIDDLPFVQGAVEELLRRHGIANVSREIAGDFAYKGVDFRSGDLILPASVFVGLDERANPDPLAVDFQRKGAQSIPFGVGRHACPGSNLARRELQVFLQEWLRRIPEFRLKSGSTPEVEVAPVNAMLRLELEWD